MIRFTESCEDAIRRHDLLGYLRQLRSQLDAYTSVSVASDDAGGQQADAGAHVLELKLKALILDTIHNIEVVEQLNTSSLSDVADWQWQKQLRFVCHVLCFYSVLTGHVVIYVVYYDCHHSSSSPHS